MAEDRRKAWVRRLIAVQFALPGGLLLARWITGEALAYGWGWQMYSR